MKEFEFNQQISSNWFLTHSIFPLGVHDDGALEILSAQPDNTLPLDILAAVLIAH
ncbi:hypothetical protein K8T06_14320 [bacterium]|nr:hypothetical protein [bacterium]